ncbi:MAG: hypothetical protein KDC45_12740 [Bacteroidetes bacterium]|nr:hypothetical protein [Bacteroidota bacterium]
MFEGVGLPSTYSRGVVIVIEGFSYSNPVESEEFRDVAEMYFNNYLLNWCTTHNIDSDTQKQMIRILADYSQFFFDSLMHQWSEEEGERDDLKN